MAVRQRKSPISRALAGAVLSKTTKQVTIALQLPLPKLNSPGATNLRLLIRVRLAPKIAREAAATTSLLRLLVKRISLLVVLLLARKLVV